MAAEHTDSHHVNVVFGALEEPLYKQLGLPRRTWNGKVCLTCGAGQEIIEIDQDGRVSVDVKGGYGTWNGKVCLTCGAKLMDPA